MMTMTMITANEEKNDCGDEGMVTSEGDGDDVWRASLVFVGLRGSKEKIVPLFPLPAL